MKKTQQKEDTPEPANRQTSIVLFPKDDTAINAVIAQGLALGIRLSISEVIRLCVRRGSTLRFTEEEFRTILKENRAKYPSKKK